MAIGDDERRKRVYWMSEGWWKNVRKELGDDSTKKLFTKVRKRFNYQKEKGNVSVDKEEAWFQREFQVQLETEMANKK